LIWRIQGKAFRLSCNNRFLNPVLPQKNVAGDSASAYQKE